MPAAAASVSLSVVCAFRISARAIASEFLYNLVALFCPSDFAALAARFSAVSAACARFTERATDFCAACAVFWTC